LEKIDRGGPVYYQFEQWLDTPSIVHAVFTRLGGTSAAPWDSLNVGGTVGDRPDAVKRNLDLMYETLELDGGRACTVWQVHSADAVVADEPPPGRRWLARADGVVTNRPGVPLTMRFADCVPILFFDPRQRAIGMAHAGWRGTVRQVVASTLRAMQTAFGTDPADVQAAIGPSIGPDHYQVGPEVVEAVRQAFGSSDGLVRKASDGTDYLDLWAANRLALERAGVHQIEVAGMCTASNVAEFYSHRAERGRTGRFGVMIALTE
jgi:purine-nucleoside/S-methyl-5'-thioadenosine phosphorylase / adenosine deaminase